MTITYTLNENDLLTHHLYAARRYLLSSKWRFIRYLGVPMGYGAFAILYAVSDKPWRMALFLTIGLLWFILYPRWEKWKYKRHYRRYIRDNYNELIGRKQVMALHDDYIECRSGNSEGKIAVTEIKEIVELSDLILLRMKTAQTIPVPLSKSENRDALRNEFRKMADNAGIPYILNVQWRWR